MGLYKVIHITTFLHSGAGAVLGDIAAAQVRQGYQVAVLANKTEEPGFGYSHYEINLNTLKSLNIPLYFIDSTFKRDLALNLQAVDFARSLIEEGQINFIHAHAAIPALVGLLARSGLNRKIPIIQTAHGWGRNKTREHELMDVTIMNGLDKVVAVSESEKELIISKGVKDEKIIVIYNGCDEATPPFDPEDKDVKEIQDLRQKGYFIFGCVGNVCERKNQALLLKAFIPIAKEKKAALVLIGEGEEPLLSNLKKEAKENRVDHLVKFLGYKKQGNSFMPLFDCFILPSQSEGIGISPMEAVRAKIPIILSDIPPFKEIVEDKKTGFLFKSGNLNSLIKTIQDVIVLPVKEKREIVEDAYHNFLKKFTKKTMLERYFDLSKVLIAQI